MKFYFCHYGIVTSMNKQDAIQLCKDALSGQGYNLGNYKSSKVLKRPELRRYCGFYQNNRYIDVKHCLDWSDYDWNELLIDLLK
jgi:hypothetical protein